MTEAALSTDPDAALGKLTVEDVSGPGGLIERDVPGADGQSSVSFSRCKANGIDGCTGFQCFLWLLVYIADSLLYYHERLRLHPKTSMSVLRHPVLRYASHYPIW